MGRFDATHIYVISRFAYDAYWKRSPAPSPAKDIYARLAASGLVEVRQGERGKTALWPVTIDGTARSVLKFRRDMVNFPITNPPPKPLPPKKHGPKKKKAPSRGGVR